MKDLINERMRISWAQVLAAQEAAMVTDSGADDVTDATIVAALTPAAGALYKFLPLAFRHQLLLDRDPHGNVQVAQTIIKSDRNQIEYFYLILF
jgi:hypothetical protein